MISIKGPGLKIFTAILAVIALEFDFIDHENNKTTKHLVGHAEEMDWNSILIDNNYTFTIDGQAVEARLGGAPRFTREGEQVRIKYPPEKPRYAIIIK